VKVPSFHEQALRELADEALFYAAISPGLGERFVAAVEAALKLAAQYPTIGSPYKH
jgi:toxin ParE1/3/4